MQIQKLSAIFCGVVLVGATSLNAQQTDNDMQARARQALRQKMAELDAQGDANATNAAPAPASAAPATPAPAVMPAIAPAPVVQPVVAPDLSAPASAATPQVTPEQLEQLRNSTRQSIANLNAQGPKAKVVATSVATPASANYSAQPAAGGTPSLNYQWSSNSNSTPAAAVVTAPAATPTAEEISDAQRAQIEQRLHQQEMALDAEKKAAAKANSHTPIFASSKAEPVFPASTPDANPAMTTKEQELNQLLESYKADRISPTEYHQQRAKILGEP